MGTQYVMIGVNSTSGQQVSNATQPRFVSYEFLAPVACNGIVGTYQPRLH